MCDEEHGYDDQFDDAVFYASKGGNTSRPAQWPRSASEMRGQTVIMNESMDDRSDAGHSNYQVAARLSHGCTAKNISRSQIFANAEALDDGSDARYSDYRLATPAQRALYLRDAPTVRDITRHQEFARDAIDDGAEAGYSDYRIATRAGATRAGAPSSRNQIFTM